MPQIIKTVSANCQDCNRCVRLCPVGAIRMMGGLTRVDGSLCVQCGMCVRECPQGGKTVHSSLDIVAAWIDAGIPVAASVAPSFCAVYPGWRARRLPAALRLLGFTSVSEAAEGAKVVADASAAMRGKASISSRCPVIVNYVEKYRPELIPLLIPVASSMIAHGRMLKARLGEETKVVHIGPCAARKGEALRPENRDAVDAVLTFEELSAWMEAEGISLSTCVDSDFETYGDIGDARLFALEGGLLRTAGIPSEPGDTSVLRVSGSRNVMQLLDTPQGKWPYDIVDPLFCRGGCIGGPCVRHNMTVFDAAQDVAKYAQKADTFPGHTPAVELSASFVDRSKACVLPTIGEARIQQILEETGKADPANQLNCGACGYSSCRDNAIAVARGFAEPGMCMSYVRKKAESRANRIIETSPNGIVVVDMDLNIVHLNARFQQMFGCGGNMIGRPVSSVVDPDGFEKLAAGAVGTQEAIRTRERIKYQELIFTLPGGDELSGIYVDVSGSTFDAKQVDLIKDQSLKHAKDLLAHQIRFSQEMAHYLGKSTAETEELVQRLVEMYAEGEPR